MSWDDYWRKRIEKVKDNVPLDQLLEDEYNIPIRRKDEVQFPCPLHGDGKDKRFSGRYYPDTNSTYCWACKQPRDAISWVQDYEKKRRGNPMDFSEALQELEQRYNINPPSPPQDRERGGDEPKPISKEFKELCRIVDGEDPSGLEDRVTKRLDGIETRLRQLVPKGRKASDFRLPIMKLFYMVDNLRHNYNTDEMSGADVGKVASKVESKVMKIARKAADG